ncbi:MAG: hypothetical protein LBR29_09810, partial [Methylobacteriaceae bacterium]|nr:hypothetical protein [Methylobacteriaceae bacterium]
MKSARDDQSPEIAHGPAKWRKTMNNSTRVLKVALPVLAALYSLSFMPVYAQDAPKADAGRTFTEVARFKAAEANQG